MTVDTKSIISETEVNQDDNSPTQNMTDDEIIDIVAAQILRRFKPAFEELAK